MKDYTDNSQGNKEVLIESNDDVNHAIKSHYIRYKKKIKLTYMKMNGYTLLYKSNYGSFYADHQIQVFVKDCRDEICNF